MKSRFAALSTPLVTVGWALLIRALINRMLLPIADRDLWWHLASGRWMVEKHVFLRTDVFSHTFQGEPWINFEWLSQILLALLEKHAGLDAIFYAKIFLGISIFAVFLATLGLNADTRKDPWTFVLAAAGFGLLSARLNTRVELATLLFMPALVMFLNGRLRREPLRWKTAVAFYLVAVVWCNLHGGFIFGIGFTGAFWMGSLWANDERFVQRNIFKILGLFLAAMFTTPHGPKIIGFFTEHLAQVRKAPGLIEEWAPTTVQSAPVFWGVFLVGAAFLITAALQRSVVARRWLPAVFLFSVWGAVSFRNAALLAFVALPALREVNAERHWFDRKQTIGIAIAAAALLIWKSPRRSSREHFAWTAFPVDACQFMQDNGIRGPLYNSYDLGGYIEWALGPDVKIFMDGRYIFHPLLMEQQSLDEASVLRGDLNAWPEALERRGISIALINRDAPREIMFPSARWAFVFADSASQLLLKRTPENRELIERLLRTRPAP